MGLNRLAPVVTRRKTLNFGSRYHRSGMQSNEKFCTTWLIDDTCIHIWHSFHIFQKSPMMTSRPLSLLFSGLALDHPSSNSPRSRTSAWWARLRTRSGRALRWPPRCWRRWRRWRHTAGRSRRGRRAARPRGPSDCRRQGHTEGTGHGKGGFRGDKEILKI